MIVSGWLHSVTPDEAITGFTVGMLLIYVELNRPGRVLPGAVGLVSVLLAIAAVVQRGDSWLSAVLAATAAIVAAMQLRWAMHWLVAAGATAVLIAGFWKLPGGGGLHAATAVLCGLTLGASTQWLASAARRARASKRVD